MLFGEEMMGEGDEFMAVKPWLGAIKEPSGYGDPPKGFDKAPKATPVLQHVFGYRAKDCRNNCFYNKEGKIIYNAAAVGIKMS